MYSQPQDAQDAAVDYFAAKEESNKPLLSSDQLSLVVLLKVLSLYQQCLPEAIKEAGFDAGKLLSQVGCSRPLESSVLPY